MDSVFVIVEVIEVPRPKYFSSNSSVIVDDSFSAAVLVSLNIHARPYHALTYAARPTPQTPSPLHLPRPTPSPLSLSSPLLYIRPSTPVSSKIYRSDYSNSF